MKLKLGKMTSKEIAQWLGMSYNGFKNNKEKYLAKLDLYAIYEKVYGGVIIKKIFIEEYDKNLAKKMDVRFLQEVASARDNLATMSGMARKFSLEDKTKYNNTRNQLTKTRNKLFGDGKGGYGITGKREYVWAIKVNDLNCYRLPNEQETELFNSLIEQAYGKDNVEKIKASAMIDKIYRETPEMSKEEYFELKEAYGLNFFDLVISHFKTITNLQLVHANKYELGLDFKLSPSEIEYRTYLFSKLE